MGLEMEMNAGRGGKAISGADCDVFVAVAVAMQAVDVVKVSTPVPARPNTWQMAHMAHGTWQTLLLLVQCPALVATHVC